MQRYSVYNDISINNLFVIGKKKTKKDDEEIFPLPEFNEVCVL